MKTRTKLACVTALVMALGIGVYAAHSQSQPHGLGPFGQMGMMMGPGMMGMAHDETTMAQLQVIHTMLANHNRIRRTVTNLPNGIRTTTESDDPSVADQIKTHVAEMGKRGRTGDDPGPPIESANLHP